MARSIGLRFLRGTIVYGRNLFHGYVRDRADDCAEKDVAEEVEAKNDNSFCTSADCGAVELADS